MQLIELACNARSRRCAGRTRQRHVPVADGRGGCGCGCRMTWGPGAGAGAFGKGGPRDELNEPPQAEEGGREEPAESGPEENCLRIIFFLGKLPECRKQLTAEL